MTISVIKHTWRTPVNNCDMGFQNRDRDCAKFAIVAARPTENRQRMTQ